MMTMKVFPFEYKKNLISNIKFLEKNKEWFSRELLIHKIELQQIVGELKNQKWVDEIIETIKIVQEQFR